MISREQELLTKAYVEDNKSVSYIAKQLDTHPNTIRRKLISYGVKLRTKAEAQKLALETGRGVHPTKGKERSETTRNKIGESLSKNWKNKSEEEKTKFSEKAKQRWDAMTPEELEEFRKKSGDAVRYAGKHGSKLERYLLLELQRAGFKVIYHAKQVVANEKLECDLLLPDHKVVIEIDGPAHYLPIWGEENLAKHLENDADKNGLLMNAGFCVIRVKHLVKNISEIYKKTVLTKLISVLNSEESKSVNLIKVEV